MNFLEALRSRKQAGGTPVIPDIKCFSPKDGDLLCGRDPVLLAEELERAGACALSVVTEETEFRGSLRLLREVCSRVQIPVLRKDFLETAADLEETRAAGASAVLLMYSCLGKEKLTELYGEALRLGLIPFVETHTEQHLTWAAELGAELVGINDRDILRLERDDGDVSHAAGLLHAAPEKAFLVVESGIRNGEDVRSVVRRRADAVLVGTAILREKDPAAAYRAMTRPCGLKICGLTDRAGIDLCLSHRVDVLGFVTEYPVPVPWNMERGQAAELLRYFRERTAHRQAGGPKACVVTGGSPEKVTGLVRVLRPDLVQLHGMETLEETARIAEQLRKEGVGVIRSIPAEPEMRRAMFGTSEPGPIVRALEKTEVQALLLDSRDADCAAAGGGSILAKAEDSTKQALAAASAGIVIGGGMTAANAWEAVRTFRPDMIDIMTGVETAPGKKSPELLGELISALEAYG